ncbi:MAG: hypothetical protein WCI18_00255 [Pseudomonadota bacterium]
MKMNFGLFTATALTAIMAGANVANSAPELVDGHYCANNSCKGKSDCGGMGNNNGCMGKNECKGKGFLTAASAADCKKAGGKWAAASEPKMDGEAAAPKDAAHALPKDAAHAAPKKKK